MSDTLARVEGLCAGYGAVPAISDVDLEINAGEIVALLGANGAGKTSTLLALSGVLRPMSGRVDLFGKPAHRSVLRRIRSGLALLPEQRGIIMGLTVRENLAIGRGKASDGLHYFPELERRLDTRAGLLSGGEQQMLALARILAAKPQLILADELSLGLAPLIVRRLLETLRDVAASGVGVLIVEQHPHVALSWSDRAYVMRRGKVEMSLASDDFNARRQEVTSLYL